MTEDEFVNCEWLIAICYFGAGRDTGRQVLRPGASPTPNPILTRQAKDLNLPNDK